VSDERLLETFLDLVRIPSPSLAEGAVARYVQDVLSGAGMEVAPDRSAALTGSDTGNLIGLLAGSVPGKRVLLSAHLDTVEPCDGVEPVVEGGVVRSKGDTVLGADDKAGVAVIIEAVRRIAESEEGFADVGVVLTVGEEKGLVGAKALDPADLEGDLCVVLDADGVPGGMVVAAPTHYTFVATFHGRSAHAGVQPERGRSALVMASKAVAAMDIGRLDEETTTNIGAIQGGVATNIVAASAVVTGECRSLSDERVEGVRDGMDRALREAAGELEGSVDVEWTREYRSFAFAEDDPVIALMEAACRDTGLEARPFKTGGGSDGNIIHAKGIPTLVLASGMRDVHGIDESIEVADLEALASLLMAVLRHARD
jgi:tripeptide aminopeptidase